MLKVFAVLFFVPSLLLFSFSDIQKNISNSFPTPSPTKTPANNKQEGVENLTLDKEIVYLVCPIRNSYCSEDELNISVETFSRVAEKNNLNYYYVVSGGQIVGEGEKVVWNLFRAGKPGKYTITAGVGNDNILIGNTITKTIELKECDECDVPCECPTINVFSSKKDARNGETVEFKAEVTGGSQTKIDYNWTVEDGIIIEGQGSPTIKAQILTNQHTIATVEIGGLCETCIQTASESVTLIR